MLTLPHLVGHPSKPVRRRVAIELQRLFSGETVACRDAWFEAPQVHFVCL
jgi:hypothetical protein